MMNHEKLTLSFYLNLLFLCISIGSFSGCTNKGDNESAPFEGDAAGEFTREKPYALMVAEARSIYHAENIARRLSKMNVPTEIIATEDDESGGAWFRILVGHSKDTTELYKVQKLLSNKYQLNSLKEYYYPEIKSKLIAGTVAEFRKKETQRVKSGGVFANPAVDEVIRRYPYSPDYILKFAAVFHSPQTKKQEKYFSVSKARIANDLPRGLKRSDLLRHTDAYCEVKLEDNLYGDDVTVNVIKLKEKPLVESNSELSALLDDPVRFYGQKILDTGDYITENMKPFKVNALKPLEGVLVTIEPKPNYIRTYGILADPAKRFIYFSQSTKKSLDEIKKLLSYVGKSEGLLAYQEFHNAFSILPNQPHPMDMFVAFYMRRLTWNYAKQKNYRRWAKQSVGRWYSEANHHTKGKGYWSYGSVDFISESAATANVKLVAGDGRTKVSTYGRTGYRLSERRRYKRSYKSYNFPVEVSLSSGRLKVWVANGGRMLDGNRWKWGWLNSDMLVDRMERLQLDQIGGYKRREKKESEASTKGLADFSHFLEGFGDSCRFGEEFLRFYTALMDSDLPTLEPPISLRSSFGLITSKKRGKRQQVDVLNGTFHGLTLNKIVGVQKKDGIKRVELIFNESIAEVEHRLIPKIKLKKVPVDELETGDHRDIYQFKKTKKKGTVVCAWK